MVHLKRNKIQKSSFQTTILEASETKKKFLKQGKYSFEILKFYDFP